MTRCRLFAVVAATAVLVACVASSAVAQDAFEPLAAEALFDAIAQREDAPLRERAVARAAEFIETGSAEKRVAALRAVARANDVPFDRAAVLEATIGLIEGEAEPATLVVALRTVPTLRPDEATADRIRTAAARLAEHESPEVRAAAGGLLGGGMPGGVQPAEADDKTLLALLSDDDPAVVIRTMQPMWGKPLSPEVEAKVIELSRLPADASPRELSPGNGNVAYVAVYYVLSTRTEVREPVARRLVEVMQDYRLDQNWRGRASWGMSHHSIAPEAVELVVEALANELGETLNGYVRRNCVYGLGRLATDSALARLHELAEDEREPEDLRQSAQEALARAGARATGS